MKQTPAPEERPGLRAVTHKTAWPLWGAAAVWILAALLLPMYRIYHYIIYAALSVVVWILLDRLIPRYTEYVPEPAKKTDTGNAELDAKIDEINRAMARLTAVAGKISAAHPDTATSLYGVIATIVKIRDDLIEDPADLPAARRFLNYYLSTTVKLGDKYEQLSRQQLSDGTVGSTMKSIEASFPVIDASLKKLLDALFENDLLDVSTDIEVLDAMLIRDGIREDGISAPSGDGTV